MIHCHVLYTFVQTQTENHHCCKPPHWGVTSKIDLVCLQESILRNAGLLALSLMLSSQTFCTVWPVERKTNVLMKKTLRVYLTNKTFFTRDTKQAWNSVRRIGVFSLNSFPRGNYKKNCLRVIDYFDVMMSLKHYEFVIQNNEYFHLYTEHGVEQHIRWIHACMKNTGITLDRYAQL